MTADCHRVLTRSTASALATPTPLQALVEIPWERYIQQTAIFQSIEPSKIRPILDTRYASLKVKDALLTVAREDAADPTQAMNEIRLPLPALG